MDSVIYFVGLVVSALIGAWIFMCFIISLISGVHYWKHHMRMSGDWKCEDGHSDTCPCESCNNML